MTRRDDALLRNPRGLSVAELIGPEAAAAWGASLRAEKKARDRRAKLHRREVRIEAGLDPIYPSEGPETT